MYSKLIATGRLTRDPETRETKNGGTMTTARMAYQTHVLGSEQDNFIDLVLFGKRAITFANYAKRGQLILVEGQLRLERTRDEETGQTRERARLFVDNFQFLERSDREDEGQPNPAPGKPIQTKRVEASSSMRFFEEEDDAYDPFLD